MSVRSVAERADEKVFGVAERSGGAAAPYVVNQQIYEWLVAAG